VPHHWCQPPARHSPPSRISSSAHILWHFGEGEGEVWLDERMAFCNEEEHGLHLPSTHADPLAHPDDIVQSRRIHRVGSWMIKHRRGCINIGPLASSTPAPAQQLSVGLSPTKSQTPSTKSKPQSHTHSCHSTAAQPTAWKSSNGTAGSPRSCLTVPTSASVAPCSRVHLLQPGLGFSSWLARHHRRSILLQARDDAQETGRC
ncbi:hypothetical protein CPC08DRAFT_187189, partial [Agrocybe pediades]